MEPDWSVPANAHFFESTKQTEECGKFLQINYEGTRPASWPSFLWQYLFLGKSFT